MSVVEARPTPPEISVWEASRESFRIAGRHWTWLVTAAAIPVALTVAVPQAHAYLGSVVVERLLGRPETLTVVLHGLFSLRVAVIVLALAGFLVLWLQRLLVEDPARRTWTAACRATARLAVYGGGVAVALWLVANAVVPVLSGYPHGYLGAFAAMAPIVILVYRALLVVPAVVSGERLGVREAMRALRGHTWRLFGVWLVTAVAVGIAGSAAFYGLAHVLNGLGASHALFFGVLNVFELVVNYLGGAVAGASLVLFYRRLVRGDAPAA